jgi:phage baseplate assembly protein V
MDDFLNLIKGQAAQLDQAWAHPRVAVVGSSDMNTYTVRVLIQPEGVLSGWLPVSTIWAGNGWGLACLPQPGDQVVVVYQEGDAEQGVVIGRLWSNNVPAPVAPGGEFWLVHASGATIQLKNDGTIHSQGSTWVHSGDLTVTGNISDYHGSLADLRDHYNIHDHPPDTSPPVPLD